MIQMGTVPQEACLETIHQWGQRVIPHFRRREVGAGAEPEAQRAVAAGRGA
jgi:hypothetical protein